MLLLISNDKIVGEANDDYLGPMETMVAPEDYEIGSFVLPGRPVVVEQVTLAAGILALKRHTLVDEEAPKVEEVPEGEESPEPPALGKRLVYLDPEHPGTAISLFAQVKDFYESLPEGEMKDRIDIALTSTQYWRIASSTVQAMCTQLGLTDEQRSVLFAWARSQEDSF